MGMKARRAPCTDRKQNGGRVVVHRLLRTSHVHLYKINAEGWGAEVYVTADSIDEAVKAWRDYRKSVLLRVELIASSVQSGRNGAVYIQAPRQEEHDG